MVEKSVPEKRARILTLDLMRGLFLLIIFADHLGFIPSFPFQYFTHSSAAFASAAEGFFVISGVLVGYIYGPRILTSLKACTKKIWKRAGLLYVLSVVFTLVYTVWAHLLPDGYARAVPLESSFFDIIFKTFTLQYQFGWADFLARYAVFMAIAPLLIWLVAKRFAWLVLILSGAVWFFWRDQPILQVYTAWQLLFTAGITLGYYLPTIEKWAKKIPRIPSLILWWSFVFGMVLSYILVIMWMNVTTIDWSPPGIPEAYLHYFDKPSLSIGRLVFGTIWFIGLYLLFRRFEATIDRVTGGFLLVFGQNSLFVYSLQAFIIFTLDVFFPLAKNGPILLNSIVYLAGIALIYFAVRFRYRIVSHSKNFLLYLRKKGIGNPI
jgi:hypothetical protein